MGTGGADGDYPNFDNDAYQRNLLPMQRPMPSNSLEGGGLHDEDGDEHSNASDGCLSKATSHSSWNANDSREGSERGGDDEDTSEEDDGDELRKAIQGRKSDDIHVEGDQSTSCHETHCCNAEIADAISKRMSHQDPPDRESLFQERKVPLRQPDDRWWVDSWTWHHHMSYNEKQAFFADKFNTRPHVGTLSWAYLNMGCLLYTSPSPRDGLLSRMPSSA